MLSMQSTIPILPHISLNNFKATQIKSLQSETHMYCYSEHGCLWLLANHLNYYLSNINWMENNTLTVSSLKSVECSLWHHCSDLQKSLQ